MMLCRGTIPSGMDLRTATATHRIVSCRRLGGCSPQTRFRRRSEEDHGSEDGGERTGRGRACIHINGLQIGGSWNGNPFVSLPVGVFVIDLWGKRLG